MKLYENTSSGSLDVPCQQMDWQTWRS